MTLQVKDAIKPDKGASMRAAFSNALAALIIVLLVAFFALTVRNSAEVNSRVETIEDGTYVVSIEAGLVETGLVRLQTLAERPMYVRTDEALDAVESSFAATNAETRTSVDYIFENHINVELREDLYYGYEELVDLFEGYLALCRDPEATDAQVRAYYEEKINPKVNELLAVNTGIFEVANARVEELCADVDRLERQSIALASVLMVAVLVSLVVYLSFLHRNRRREEELKASLQDALELAQSANRAKSIFLSNMSHDIRTPMNAIVGLTNIADAHVDEPHRVQECLDRIKVSSRHLLSLINDVLDMSRIESGKIILNEGRFSLVDFMNDIATIVQPQARTKNLQFEIEVGDLSHDHVIGDRLRLDQAVINLISNAMKYTPDGGMVRLTMNEESSGQEGYGSYRFVVQDSGVGMTPEFLERIYEPFECERNTAISHTEGVGLGMSITKNMVDMMGGSIQIESELGVGTVVTMIVPLKVNEEAEAEGVAEQYVGHAGHVALASAAATLGEALDSGERDVACDAALASEPEDANDTFSGRVLLVEDNPLNSEIATELITMFGAEVDQAFDGQEAVDMLTAAADGLYGLVLMDVQMPRMNGLEATKCIRETFAQAGRPYVPIVAMTANAFDQDREEALAAGMDGFMAKPINLDELKHCLQVHLR